MYYPRVSYLQQSALGSVVDDLTTAALQRGAPAVGNYLNQYREWFRRQGRETGKSIVASLHSKLPGGVTPAPSSLPLWAQQMINPILDPFVDGLMEELNPAIKKTAIAGAASVAGIGLFIGYVLGK